MEIGQSSRTALTIAGIRARYQFTEKRRVFTDPFAVPIVGDFVYEEGNSDRNLDPELALMRLFILARSRFADDTVAAAIADRTRQVVVLGAGLDTSAYRNTNPDVRFFEVDHPDTQRWKRNRLAEAGIEVPPTLNFVPVDFEKSTLAEGLAEARFDRAQPAVFVWLGVVMYLTRPSITDTWRYIADQVGVQLVMDYLYPASTPSMLQRAEHAAALGEPWLSSFTDSEIRSDLVSLGFTTVEDYSGAELLTRYLGEEVPSPTDSGPHLIRASVGT
ncbi:class I SAM-dependent methyltransferase [Nocardia fluminea]|uniref:class I SAM-dependent methyltransferase n=1 Tax=Nocardia fluminea TaxID=134984 RepID=UPI003D0F53AE